MPPVSASRQYDIIHIECFIPACSYSSAVSGVLDGWKDATVLVESHGRTRDSGVSVQETWKGCVHRGPTIRSLSIPVCETEEPFLSQAHDNPEAPKPRWGMFRHSTAVPSLDSNEFRKFSDYWLAQ